MLAQQLDAPTSVFFPYLVPVLLVVTICFVVGFCFLAREVARRKRSETELKQLNERLEWEVEERTQSLSTANRKLEADLALRKQIEERLRELATVDELTGLSNRREFDRLLADEVRRHRRYSHPLSLLLADIDHFKAANDTHGHQAGDAMLRRIAQVIKGALRATDRVARYGGEEIAVILPETSEVDALEVAEHLRKLVAATSFTVNGAAGDPKEVQLTVSVGAAEMSPRMLNKQDLVLAADSALYQAKSGGRNRSERFNGKLISGPLPEDLWQDLPVVPASPGLSDVPSQTASRRDSGGDGSAGAPPASAPHLQGPDRWST